MYIQLDRAELQKHECNFSWSLELGCHEDLITICKIWLKPIHVIAFEVDLTVLHPLYTRNWLDSYPGQLAASFVQAFAQ